ncbi:MAG: hypothetical protein SV062_13280 [Thermodesulfobacteriota bacterium]|nr:hypothetical protein [Thermodesulfobacteriota bacterium]
MNMQKNRFVYLSGQKGVSVIALIIMMVVLGGLGYVFSSLIATKQYSMGMAAPSQQAFYVAESGIEYGIRYASERGWTTGPDLNNLDGITVNPGQGQFSLDYDVPSDTLSSTGQVSGSRREVNLENFTLFVSNIQCIELVTGIDPPPISGIPPCTYTQGNRTFIRFYIRNICSSQPAITLTQFMATWNPPQRRLQRIWFDGNLKFQGGYSSGDPWTAFNRGGGAQDVNTCHGARYQGIEVRIRFNNILAGNTTFTLRFRDTNGEVYVFNLGDPPNC